MSASDQPLIRLDGVTKVFLTDEVETMPSRYSMEIRRRLQRFRAYGAANRRCVDLVCLIIRATAATGLRANRPDLHLSERARVRNETSDVAFRASIAWRYERVRNVELPQDYRGTSLPSERRSHGT